ncbi:putative DNA-binding protein [Buttiauxella ferragutiae ATCC 51602]|uniref:DNA-binding protein n=1 Tax=Buttiauxella ferragutiae ATCC 51602 TaxID=1354252 RepID=A0ABX2W6Y7_9ENTR|nr:helix-turn-helix transcriptional regulator [Buttiauxella ferragutiae]OAT26711.1 putative DNA-binding protein [Buttiauxella ferragutiae ATCC 51602]
MSRIQFITDADGVKQSAVIPIELFNRLVESADLDEFYESIPVEAGPHDNETIPNEVVEIKYDKDVSLQAAWRIYRGMTQDDVATALSISQAAVAKMEKSQKPQKATLEKLAALYDCRATQLLLD